MLDALLVVSSYKEFIQDPDILPHSQRVAALSKLMAAELNMNKEETQELEICCLLHDIGKTGIDKNILNKAGPLSNEEMLEIRKHPLYGCMILKQYHVFSEYAPVILHHHEDFDGHGYPNGLKGFDIPYYSRIIRVVDIFDALCSDRAYRKKFTVQDALNLIEKEFKSKIDPGIYKAFLNSIGKI